MCTGWQPQAAQVNKQVVLMGGGGICPSLYSLTSTIGYHIQSFLTSGHCCPFCPIDPWSSRLFGPLDLLLSRPYPSRSLIFPLFGPLDPWSSRPLDPWSERPRISLAGPQQNLLAWPEPVSSTFAITQLEPNLVYRVSLGTVYCIGKSIKYLRKSTVL